MELRHMRADMLSMRLHSGFGQFKRGLHRTTLPWLCVSFPWASALLLRTCRDPVPPPHQAFSSTTMYRSPKQKKRNKAAKVTKVAIVYLYHVFRKHPKSRTKDLSCERKLVRPAFLLLLSILVHLSLHETTSFNIRQQNMTVSQSTFLHLE